MRAKLNEMQYAETEAAMLLGGAIAERARERVSLRELGRRLEYKQPVVLSHMLTGRVPIPIDRAVDIAKTVGLPPRQFLIAVLEQRHPDVDWSMLTALDDEFVEELCAIAGGPLASMPADQKHVVREAVADHKAAHRWLSIAELGAVELIRKLRPRVRSEGLTGEERKAIRDALGTAG